MIKKRETVTNSKDRTTVYYFPYIYHIFISYQPLCWVKIHTCNSVMNRQKSHAHPGNSHPTVSAELQLIDFQSMAGGLVALQSHKEWHNHCYFFPSLSSLPTSCSSLRKNKKFFPLILFLFVLKLFYLGFAQLNY